MFKQVKSKNVPSAVIGLFFLDWLVHHSKMFHFPSQRRHLSQSSMSHMLQTKLLRRILEEKFCQDPRPASTLILIVGLFSVFESKTASHPMKCLLNLGEPQAWCGECAYIEIRRCHTVRRSRKTEQGVHAMS